MPHTPDQGLRHGTMGRPCFGPGHPTKRPDNANAVGQRMQSCGYGEKNVAPATE